MVIISKYRLECKEDIFCNQCRRLHNELPVSRDVPTDRLYVSPQIEDAIGRLTYAADRQLFAVVTADPGCGKSTLIRMFEGRLPKDKYMLLYLSDSKLTPRWLYAGLLDQNKSWRTD